MARNKLSREANLRSSIYRGEDGYWHGRVTVGVRDDGTPRGEFCYPGGGPVGTTMWRPAH